MAYVVGLGNVIMQETTVQKRNCSRAEVDESDVFILINLCFDLIKVDGAYNVKIDAIFIENSDIV